NTSLGPPSISADGRIAFPRWGSRSFDLWLLEPGSTPRALTEDDVFDYAPRWLPDGRLLFTREHDGRAQAAWMDPETGTLEILSDAPHLVMDPVPLSDGRIAFLNREGWSFSLDTLPLPETPAGRELPRSSDAEALAEASSSEGEGDRETPSDEAQKDQERSDEADAPAQAWVRDSVSGVRLLASEEVTEQ